MANLTKNEKYIVDMYVRYFGKAPSVAEIAKYNEFGKPKLILKEIIGDADDSKAGLTTEEFVNNAFQNLFGRDATTKDMNKYSKVVDKGKDLPINAIVKAAKKSDKGVYEAKKAIAIMLAEKDITTNYNLDKITKDTYADVYNLKTKTLLVDSVAALGTKIDAMLDNVAGKTFNLTASADTGSKFVGTEKGDVFKADSFVSANGTYLPTLNSSDELDGGAGKDTLNITNEATNPATTYTMASATIKNIETITIKAANSVSADVSGSNITGLETISVLKSVNADVTAAATTDVNVSGATGTIDVDGGKNVTVTDAEAAVVLDNAKGNVTVTDATQTAAITINDGANVTVTATSAVSNSTITIGGTNGGNTGNATGDVVVTSNLNGADAATLTGAAINVTGGKTVNVTVNATSAETTDDTTVSATNQGAINVTADNTTTSVTVKQTASVTGSDAATAVAGVNEVSTIKFVTLANNGAVTIDGLTFTNTSGVALSAADVAAAFANLTAGEIQGCSTKGTYSGAWGGNWTSSAVATDTVTFTAVAQSTASDITASATIVGTTVNVVTAGVTAVTADAGKGTIATGVVKILDNATASIKTVSVDGYKTTSVIGVNGASTAASLNALTDLTLANSDIGADIDVATTATSLNLTLNNITSKITAVADSAKINLDHNGNATADGSKTIKTLNITTAGKDSDVEITAAAVETLTVSGTNALDLTASTLTALKTVTVSGTAGLTIAASGANVTSVTTTATTGAVTASIDAANATYTGGAGVDTVTLVNDNIDKAISLGAGDDKLTLATGTALADITVTVDGGAGDADTLVMDAVDAQDASASNAFDLKVINFERLSLLQVAVDNATATVSDVVTVDLSKLTYDYVITAGTATGGDDTAQDQLLLQNMANNGTVVLTSNGLVTVEVKDANLVANTTDVINVIVDATNTTTTAGTFTVADVETVKITAKGEFLDDGVTGGTANDGIDDTAADTASLSLVATAAKTVTVDGSADLVLDMTGNTKVTLIDGSTMTGNLTVTSYNTTAASTIKGGSGDDTLTAANANVVTTLIGGDGDDRLVDAGGFATLTGGEGNDTFVISGAATTSLFDFTTITDASSGDRIEFAEFAVADAVAFKATAVTLTNPNGATLQDYANKAISTTDTGHISWFTFGGDSYLVVNKSNDALSFNNTTDTIVKLTGVTDLNASFNDSATTEAFIEIC